MAQKNDILYLSFVVYDRGEDLKNFLKFVIALAAVLAVVITSVTQLTGGGMLVERIKNFASYQEESTSTVYKSAQRNTSETASLTEKINSTLTEDEKKALDIIYDGLKNCKSSVNIYQDIEPQRIFELVGLVLSEHPEIFWSKGDCTFSQSGRLTFEYSYSKSRISEIQTQIESRVSTIMSKIDSSASEYEKALKIFDYITLNTSYARDEIENIEDNVKISTIEGVFIDNSAVCLGYAKAYQYLLNAAGIDAITVCGNAQTPDGDSGHAWNAIVIDGEIYLSDATWGDGYDNTDRDEYVSYTYFLMNNAEIELTHTPDPLYECIKSTAKDNYFVREGLCFEEYDPLDLRSKISESIEDKTFAVQFKFSDTDVYENALSQLFDKGGIYIIMKSCDPFYSEIDTDKAGYSCDDTHNCITIFFEPVNTN